MPVLTSLEEKHDPWAALPQLFAFILFLVVSILVSGCGVSAASKETGNVYPQAAPASLAFRTPASTTATQTLQVTTYNADALTATLPSGTDFHFTPPSSCLSGATSCTITVSYSPFVPGTAASLLTLTDTATGLFNTVALSGTGTAIPAPVLSLPTSSLSFNATAVGTTIVSVPLTLTNTGTAPLNLSTPVFTGTNAADYTQTNTCVAAVAPGASCTLSVQFSPSASGTRAASLQIGSNASSIPAVLALTGSGSAVAPNTLVPGANALIPLTEGSGTVAHDTTGNGNDCTFATGNNAPAWSNSGLQLNDNSDSLQKFCTLPASASNADQTVMNSRTLTLCAFFNPYSAPTNIGYATAFGGSTRNNIGSLSLSGAAHPRSAYYMGEYFGYGGVPSYTSQPLVGYHCVTYALGSATDGTLDHFYIDAMEVNHYGAQGTVWDRRAPGDFYELGALPWDPGGYLWATVYTVLAYPTQLTAQGVAHNFPVLQQSAFFSRGVGAPPVQSTTTANVLVTNGDSLTNETPNATPYPYLLQLNTPFTITDTAAANKLIETEVADSPLLDLPLYSPDARFAFISNASGINDINVGGSTQAQIIADRATLYASYQQTGFTVLSPTMLSSVNNDTEIQAINDALRSTAVANGYFLVDWANEPCFGMSGAYANPSGCSFFQADGLHPNQSGEDEMARLYSNIVNYLTGSTQANPTLVTAASYSITPADRFLTAQGTATQSVTLPSCYGWSTTTPFTLTNANLSGTVTLSPPSGFTLNGATAPTAIPAGATVQAYADLLAPASSGCGWHTR